MKSEDFQAVYRELYPSLSRYVHRFTGDTDASADIVQDAFLRLLEHDLPRDEVRPWIFVVATNLARDRVRKKERRRRLLVANQERRITASSPHEDLERAERDRCGAKSAGAPVGKGPPDAADAGRGVSIQRDR